MVCNTRHDDNDDEEEQEDEEDDITFSFYLTVASNTFGACQYMPIKAAPHGRTVTALHMLSSYSQRRVMNKFIPLVSRTVILNVHLNISTIFTYCK
jgi:hypothetical protein